MDSEKRIELITRNTEEVLTRQDLRHLVETGTRLKHYIGFEISGKVHLGTGVATMLKVRDFLEAGVDCTIFLADWHAWINDKLGGDMEVIRGIGAQYFKEGMIAGLKVVGADPEKVKFLMGTDLYHHNDDYWATVIDVSKNTTLSRIRRSITIMGRKMGEAVDFAKLIYPPMQVADIFIQGVNIAHAGMDQRKAHVVAREVALSLRYKYLEDANGNRIKPVAVHNHLLLGLQKPPVWPVPKERMQELWSQMKMSKSIPGSAVFVHDTPEEIRKKIGSAFCPARETGFNPVLDWTKHLLFSREDFVLHIERPAKYGGNVEYQSYEELEKDFASGALHPADLKKGVAEALIEFLEPARKHFEKARTRKLLEEMENLVITR